MKRETVVETDEFVRLARAIMSDLDHAALVDLVASDPEVGVSLGSGLRKVRFARSGAGKSGGYRVIHFYRADQGCPVFLLLVYAKNVLDNLSPTQLARLRLLGEVLGATYGRPP